MARHIFFVAKVFDKTKYVDEFLNQGKFRCNTLKYFKEYEDKASNNIGDYLEGAKKRITPKSGGILTLDGMKVDYLGLDFHSEAHMQFNAFCMYAPMVNENELLTVDKMKDICRIQDDAENLGQYMVFITNPEEFFKRVEACLDSKGPSHRKHCVDYVDLSSDFDIPDDRIGFVKDIRYSHQKEYRILIERENPKYEFLDLEVGSLKDIAAMIPTRDLNKSMDFKLIPK